MTTSALHAPANSETARQLLPVDLPSLVSLWRAALRRRWLILGILGTCLLLGILATVFMTRQYTATTMIEISRQNDKIVQVQDVTPDSNVADLEFYQTQYSLLTARSLAERVSTALRLPDRHDFFDKMNVDIPGESIFSRAERRVLTTEQRKERQREAVEALLDNITISPIRGSRIVEVSFTSPDAALSAEIANTWTNQFIEANLARRFDATAYARNFLEQRLEQLRGKLESSERQLVEFSAAQRIINLPSRGGDGASRSDQPIVAEDLATLNAALGDAVADRIKAESRLNGVGAAGGGAAAEAIQNSAISMLREKRADVAAEYAKTLVQFDAGYPRAKALQQQVAELDRAIAREEQRVRQSVQTSAKEARAREAGLQQRVDGLKADLLNLRRRSIQYNIYQRDVDTNRQLYEALLQRYKEIGVAGGVGTNNIALVDAAQIPEKASSPKLVLNLAVALFVGLLLAAGVTIALEQIDEAVKDPVGLERATGLPTLGVVPATANDPLAEVGDRKSATSEAFLSLQTNLQFATDHGVPRTLAVTSTQPAEGKSTTSFAIAMTLARIGRRVVLVDCDMRSPSIHEFAGVGNSRGTSNFLAGDDGLGTSLVSDPSGMITILPAGGAPPSAAELLTGSRLELLLGRLTDQFDNVVLDCPPVLGLADAPLIASRVEGVVYVVKAQATNARLIRHALERLRGTNAHMVGAILTMFVATKAHFGYGYDYGYGYGRSDEARDG